MYDMDGSKLNCVFKITEDTIAEHIKNAYAEDYSAGGEVFFDGRQFNFCIYRGELAWLTESDKEVKNQQLKDHIYCEWVSQFM